MRRSPSVEAGPATASPHRFDLWTAASGAVLFAAAAVAGAAIEHTTGSLRAPWPPLLARWMPHVGPGTPAALLIAALVVLHGPPVAARLSWRRLTWAAWSSAMAWTWSLALVDGWRNGVADRLTTRYEYLRGVDRFADVGAALRDFSRHIAGGTPESWPPHIAGHPPGAVLTFVGLDRIGLGGGGWAGAFCIVTGSSVAAAVMVTLRAVGAESTARAAVPFLVLAPAAVWVGTSADGYFAAIAAWALALLAVAAGRWRSGRGGWRGPVTALGSGLLFGLTLYLSYGLTLMALPALTILLCARTARPVPLVLLGLTAVATTFTLLGFRWWEAYPLLVERYYQGSGGVRPYAYWVWGNLACVVLCSGLAAVAGLRRALAAAPHAVRQQSNPSASKDHTETGQRLPCSGHFLPHGGPVPVVLLLCSFLTALLAADLSGMSKAETERIWLPFTLWLPTAAALLPSGGRRGWLTAQAALALLANHLLLTYW
ncbi:hypothetical protein PUR57_02410 [Streptomyces sp. JV176]|uniref:hypothetical protein n=1 Tax=Streptomyces sp. JV176 TaxID=858630 RepID=UPI002E791349|nr:hypothetical protein [Streptomyces sp. JV176]MEE1797547.1 hypothetical protein [Streptomyces sp. JV176]